MSHIIEAEVFLAIVLSCSPSVSRRELSQIRDRVMEWFPEVVVDISRNSIQLAEAYYSEMFKVTDDTISLIDGCLPHLFLDAMATVTGGVPRSLTNQIREAVYFELYGNHDRFKLPPGIGRLTEEVSEDV